VYLHLVSEGIRFNKGGKAEKTKIKHTDEKEKKSASTKTRSRALTIGDPHACQLSYKARAKKLVSAARKKCRNDGARSLALRRRQVYAEKYP